MSRTAPRPLRLSSVLVAAFGVGALNPGSPIAAAEPPVQPAGAAAEPIVRYQRDAELLGYEREALVEAYKRLGKRDPNWDKQLVAFLEDAARLRAGVESRKSIQELIDDGEAVIELGCEEPVLYAIVGSLRTSRPGDTRGETLLYSSVAQIHKDGYPREIVGYAAWSLAYHYSEVGQARRPARRRVPARGTPGLNPCSSSSAAAKAPPCRHC